MITPTHDATREPVTAAEGIARRVEPRSEERHGFREELTDELARRRDIARERADPDRPSTEARERRDQRAARAEDSAQAPRSDRDERAAARRGAVRDADPARRDPSGSVLETAAQEPRGEEPAADDPSAQVARSHGPNAEHADLAAPPSLAAGRSGRIADQAAATDERAALLASALGAAGASTSAAEGVSIAFANLAPLASRPSFANASGEARPGASVSRHAGSDLSTAESSAVSSSAVVLAPDPDVLALHDAQASLEADVQRVVDALGASPRDASESRPLAHLVQSAAGLAADASPAELARAVAPPRVPPADFPAYLEKLAVRVDASANRAIVELEPPELGRLTVEVFVEDDRIRADVRVERPEGLAALEARLPELRASFLDRGFASADVQLSLDLEHQADSQRNARDPRHTPHSKRGEELAPALLDSLVPARAGGLDLWA